MDEWSETTVSGLSALTVAYTTLLQDYDDACCQLYDCNKKLDLCTMSLGGVRDDLDEDLDKGLQSIVLEKDNTKRLEMEINELKEEREEYKKSHVQIKKERDALSLEIENLKNANTILFKEFDTYKSAKESIVQESSRIEEQLRNQILDLKNKLDIATSQVVKAEVLDTKESKADMAEKTKSLADQLKAGQNASQVGGDEELQDIIIVEHIDREFKSFDAEYSFDKENIPRQCESEMILKLDQMKSELEEAVNRNREIESELRFSKKQKTELEARVVELNKLIRYYKEEAEETHRELEVSKTVDKRSKETSQVLVELNIENQISRMPSILKTSRGVYEPVEVKA